MTSPAPPEQAADRLRAGLPRETRRCRLREVRAEDVAAVFAYRGREEVSRYLSHPPLAPGDADELVARWVAEPTAVTAVAELEGRVVGDVRIFLRQASAMAPVRTEKVEAWVGYAFHPQVQGRGLARECVAQMVTLALDLAGVRRVTARVFAPATSSSRLLAALGFHLDGVDRAAVLDPSGSVWWDDELWSLLPGELVLPGVGAPDRRGVALPAGGPPDA